MQILFTTELTTQAATVRQTLVQAGDPTAAPVIALAGSPLVQMNRQQLAALEAVFESIPELEFEQTDRLTAEAGNDRLLHDVGVDAEPKPELEFNQTLGQ